MADQPRQSEGGPDMVPIRYGRMLASPFTFYRGGALIMAADLAATPVSGVTVQLCGDAHLSNFGLFGTPERQMLFDINDFDETLPGPWEWDVKRLAASFEIMGRDRGFSPADRRAVVMEGVSEYRNRMRRAEAVEGDLRIVADPPVIIPIEDPGPAGDGMGEPGPADQEAAQLVPAHARAPAPPPGGVPLRPLGVQNGGRGQRRDPLLHLAANRPRP